MQPALDLGQREDHDRRVHSRDQHTDHDHCEGQAGMGRGDAAGVVVRGPALRASVRPGFPCLLG